MYCEETLHASRQKYHWRFGYWINVTITWFEMLSVYHSPLRPFTNRSQRRFNSFPTKLNPLVKMV